MSYSSEVLADSPLAWLRLGDAAPIAAVTPSSEFNSTTESAVNAFDGSAATQWSTNGTATGTLRAQLTSAMVLTSYKVLGRRDAFPNRSPRDWTFEGSNNGTTWTTLDTQAGITWTSGQVRTFTFSNSTAYLYYRINVSANTGDTYLNIPELTLVGVNPGTLADSSGNSRSANMQGPVWAVTGLLTGDPDAGASFDGSNSVAVIPSASWMNVSSFTVEAWIKTTKTSDYQYIITRDTQARQWDFRLKPNGNLEFEVIAPSLVSVTATGVTLNDGVRHHVVATYDGTNVRLYVDGTLVQTTGASITNSVTADLSIGAALVGTGSYGIHSFQGTIDEPAYYGTALSGTRVAAHYTAGTVPSTSGSAALSLSGSGAAQAAATGSGALSLSGSGNAGIGASGSGVLTLSGAGVIDFLPASGTGSLSLTAAGAAGIGVAGTAALTLAGTGTAVGATAASGSGSLALSASGSATLAAAGTASLTFGSIGTAFALFVTDLTNALNGRRRRARGTATVTRTAASPPPGRTFAKRYDKAIAYPTPDMVDGRPE